MDYGNVFGHKTAHQTNYVLATAVNYKWTHWEKALLSHSIIIRHIHTCNHNVTNTNISFI